MKYTILLAATLLLTSLAPRSIFAQEIYVSVRPDHALQGEPVMVQLQGVKTVTEIQKGTFEGTSVRFFLYNTIPTAFVGVPLEKKPGEYIVRVTLKNKKILQTVITVTAREDAPQPLGIPAKLGGDTATSAQKMLATLTKDHQSINNLKTLDHALWQTAFQFPLQNATVTDTYGYVRQTSGYSIAHKGTDFRAPIGTPVFAMNRGVVRKAQTYGTYGKTVIIDHGLGLFTMYMHLSKIKVSPGMLVEKGETIALSGETGYALGPHLHTTVRVGNISIDPMKFIELFK